MYFQLGNIKFENAYGPNGLSSQHTARYSNSPLVSGGNVLQKTGDDLITLNFNAFLHYSFVNITDAIADFENAKSEGEILPLIDGDGFDYGTYVIASYSVGRTEANPNGQTTTATISVNLIQYVDPDPSATLLRTAQDQAAGLSENGATPSVVESLPPTETGIVVFSMIAANSAAIESDLLIDRALILPPESASLLVQVTDILAEGKKQLEIGLQKLTEAQTIAAQAPELIDSTNAAIDVFSTAIGAARSGDLTNTKLQTLNALNATSTLLSDSSDLSINLIHRRP